MLLFGHHHVGDRHSREKADRTFGIDIDASDALAVAIAGSQRAASPIAQLMVRASRGTR